jgi:transposase
MQHQNESAREGAKMDITTLGVDSAKNLFQVHGVDGQGRILLERQLRRRQVLPFVAQLRFAWWRWRRVAAPTIGPARLPSAVTRSG